MSFPEENTLGVIIGGNLRRRESDATRRVIRAATPRRASLGTGFIGVGAAVVLGLRAIYGAVWFVGLWNVYPDPMPALIAWVVLILVLVATFIVARVIGDQLPDWMFAIFLVDSPRRLRSTSSPSGRSTTLAVMRRRRSRQAWLSSS